MDIDHYGREEEENLQTDTPDHNMSNSNRGHSPARRQSSTFKDIRSTTKHSTSFSPPQPLPFDSVSMSTSQHNSAAAYQLAVKEEESRSENYGNNSLCTLLPKNLRCRCVILH